MTNSQRMRESAVIISSTMPSAKYSCSGSPLILAKGSTAIDGLSGSVSWGVLSQPRRAAPPPPDTPALSVQYFLAAARRCPQKRDRVCPRHPPAPAPKCRSLRVRPRLRVEQLYLHRRRKYR